MHSSTKLFLGLCLLTLLTLPARAEQVLERIVAVVNDDVITSSELNETIETVSDQFEQRNGQRPPRDAIEKQVLERMIISRIQLNQSERLGIRVDDNALNEAIQDIARRNDMTLSEFAGQIEADGGDYSAFRETIREELIVLQLRQRQVDRRINISETEIEDALKTLEAQDRNQQSYRLRHLLISIPEGADEATRTNKQARLDAAMAELEAGTAFADVAVAWSDGPAALDGGDLGWRNTNEMPSLFSDAVIDASEGDIVGPLTSPNGFHLLFVEGFRGIGQAISRETLARHILIRSAGPLDDERAERKANDVYDRLQGGTDFAQLATEVSEDPGSAVDGGNLGWAPTGAFVAPFEDVLHKLEKEEISQPVKTQFGWHVIQLIDRREKVGSVDSRREQARQAIAQRKLAEEVDLWQRRLRDEAYVDIRL